MRTPNGDTLVPNHGTENVGRTMLSLSVEQARQIRSSRKDVWTSTSVEGKGAGKEHPYTLTSMNNLAEVLSRQGRYNEAEEMRGQALKLAEKGARDQDQKGPGWYQEGRESKRRNSSQDCFYLLSRRVCRRCAVRSGLSAYEFFLNAAPR